MNCRFQKEKFYIIFEKTMILKTALPYSYRRSLQKGSAFSVEFYRCLLQMEGLFPKQSKASLRNP